MKRHRDSASPTVQFVAGLLITVVFACIAALVIIAVAEGAR
jgi:hypothetical protein